MVRVELSSQLASSTAENQASVFPSFPVFIAHSDLIPSMLTFPLPFILQELRSAVREARSSEVASRDEIEHLLKRIKEVSPYQACLKSRKNRSGFIVSLHVISHCTIFNFNA